MSDPPRRRPWFQFHLSTAVVLMFVASGLLWASVHEYNEWEPLGYWTLVSKRGWPMAYLRATRLSRGSSALFEQHMSVASLVLDIAVALAILLATAVVLEWRIRRRQ
jgi:hypothetical protein